jgi:sulfotransferase family protein
MAARAAVDVQQRVKGPGQGKARAQRHVLVVGAARSGTTWVARTLGLTAGAVYLSEPDEAPEVPFATRARSHMGLLPAVEPGDEGPELYRRLWDVAFGVRRRSPLNRLANRLYADVPIDEKYAVLTPDGSPASVKLRVSIRLAKPMYARDTAMVRVVRSVQVPLALDWLVARIDPRVVLVRRHPFDVIASRVKLGFLQHSDEYLDERAVAERVERWPCPPRPTNGDAYAHLVWLTAFEMTAFDETAAAHPEFIVVEHEAMCLDPLAQFRKLARDLGLEWTDRCDRYLQTSDTPGDGFDTKRVSAAQSGKWRTQLSAEQVAVAREIVAGFPVAGTYPDLST